MAKVIKTADVRRSEETAVKRIVALKSDINITLPDNDEQLWDIATGLENESSINAAKRGIVYLTLKDRVGHGNFTKELEARDIPPERAREAMRITQMLMELPAAKRRTFAVLSGSKLLEIAKLPVDSFDDDEADDLANLSVRELKQKVRDAKSAQERAELKLEKANKNRPEDVVSGNIDPHVMAARVDISVLAEKAILAVDEMEKIMAELMDAWNGVGDAEYYPAAGAAYLNARAIWAKVTLLLNWWEEVNDKANLPDTAEAIPILAESEMLRINTLRELYLAEHTAKQLSRKSKKTGRAKRQYK